MAFIIPDHDEATHPNPQSLWFEADVECLIRALQGTASVVSGCAVTAQTPAAMGVTVAAGTVIINGAPVTVAGGNLPLDAADSEPRIDLVTVDSAGALQKVKGTPVTISTTTGPKPPDIPANRLLLAMVVVLGGATSVSNTEIVDKRITVLGGIASDALKGTWGTPSNANRFVTSTDPRMSDPRRPRLHAEMHEAGGGDEIDLTGLHGRLADPQTPDRHGRSHQAGGTDPIKLDDLTAPDDNTDLNASTAKHGLMPKGNNNIDDVYRGDVSQGKATHLRCDLSTTGRVVLPVGADKWAT